MTETIRTAFLSLDMEGRDAGILVKTFFPFFGAGFFADIAAGGMIFLTKRKAGVFLSPILWRK